jgi:hypothetical protein
MNSRIYFRVSREGFARDSTGFEYELPKSLALNVGDKFSVPAAEAPTDDRIIHTSGLYVESAGERKAFDSAEQGPAGWSPRVGNPNYSNCTPDSGRVSHPQDKHK